MAKRSSDPWVAYPEVKGTGHSASCGPPLPHGGSVPRKIRFIEPQGVNGHRRPVPGAPKQRYATGEPGKVQGRDRVGIV